MVVEDLAGPWVDDGDDDENSFGVPRSHWWLVGSFGNGRIVT